MSMDEYTYDWNPEWADDPTKPILKITKSSLGQFGWCPKKYGFSYIQRLPQDQTEAMRKEPLFTMRVKISLMNSISRKQKT